MQCVYPGRTDVHREVAGAQQPPPSVPSIDFWVADHDATDFTGSNAGFESFTDTPSIFAPDSFAASISEPSLGETLSLSAEHPLVLDAQSTQAFGPSLDASLSSQPPLTESSLGTTWTAFAASDHSPASSSGSGASLARETNDYLSHLTHPEILDMPESKERRVWELRLMHNHMLCQTRQFSTPEIVARHGEQPPPGVTLDASDLDASKPGSQNKFGGFVWGQEITNLAFENDTVLYSLLAASALEMWTRTPDPKDKEHLRLLQQKYQSMALREQRRAVASLSRDNADDVCMAALTILQNSFVLVQTLPTRPWQPPLDWLRMGKGAGAVLIVARGYLGFRNGEDRITRFLASMPRVSMEDVFRPEHRAGLTWLLDNDGGSRDNVGDHELVNNQVTLEIYHRVLSYIGYMQKAIDDKEPLYLINRRLICFAMWMPELYHEFLAQRRPRALITLAHFFKLWIPYGDLWHVGKTTGENQVRAIYEECPVEWRHKLDPIFEEYGLEPPGSASPASAQSVRMSEDGP